MVNRFVDGFLISTVLVWITFHHIHLSPRAFLAGESQGPFWQVRTLVVYLQNYDFTASYMSGKPHLDADTRSRCLLSYDDFPTTKTQGHPRECIAILDAVDI